VRRVVTAPHSSCGRRLRAVLGLLVVLPTVLLLGSAPADAAQPLHPLGNFTVNQYSGLRVGPTSVAVDHVLDAAELPTFQTRQRIDTDGNGIISAAEADAYRSATCVQRAAGLHITVAGRPVALRVLSSSVAFPPGQGGLDTGRLTCELRGDYPRLADAGSSLTFSTTLDADRVGWREVTAVGDGATLLASSAAVASRSDRLLHYPADLLTSPLDERSATVSARPGGREADPITPDSALRILPRGVDGPTNAFERLVAHRTLGPAVGALALLLSVLLGGLHALSPGHGKTVMAAFLAGRQGSKRTVAVIGATVTLTHTLGVLVLGIVLSASVTLAPQRLYPLLGVFSGLLVVGLGLNLMRVRLKLRRTVLALHGEHGEGALPHSAQVEGDDAIFLAADEPTVSAGGTATLVRVRHSHGGRAHTHVAPVRGADGSIKMPNLVALGFADGLVPSPSALVVLLGAVALHRAWFGVLLVVGYGFGMAISLVTVGLLLGRLQAVLVRRARGRRALTVQRVTGVLPLVTAAVIVVVGVYLAVRGGVQLERA